jgi:hypothetical protein
MTDGINIIVLEEGENYKDINFSDFWTNWRKNNGT